MTVSSQSGRQAPERAPRRRRGERHPGRGAEQRYVRGRRRTTAEPLTASWEPEQELRDDEEHDDRPPGRLRRLTDTYGWRIYAIPVLVVLTVLVLVDGVRGEEAGTPAGRASEDPVVTEQPAGEQELDIPTATLPTGGDYTRAGSGSWRVVSGSSPKVGSGRLYTYTVEVENGIDPAEVGGEDEDFAKLVDETLADPRGWTGSGQIAVKRVGPGQGEPDFRISLTTPATGHQPNLCGFNIKYEASCYRESTGRVAINLARWVRGAKAFGADMLGYRQYAINHEVGHAFDNGHVGCPRDGAVAPVMMQQSFGVNNDYVARLNRVEPSNREAVPADGKTCTANAWPNPANTAN